MIRYRGSSWVRVGFYWNSSRWEIVTIPKGGGVLPGENDVRYVRLPLILVMLLGPMVGALYVIFLPFIGFAMLFGFVGAKLISIARRALGGCFAEAEVTRRQER